MEWFGRAVAAGVLFIAFVGRSGGGLGPSSVCGTLNDVYVAGTVISAVAMLLFPVLGVLAIVSRALRKPAPAVPDAPQPPYGAELGPDTAIPRRSASRGLLPRVLIVAIALFVLFGPSGCTQFQVCGQANQIARAPGASLRFAGDLPNPTAAPERDASYTATFEATAPWTARWSSSADLVRVDVFTEAAVQQGNHFPTAGHPAFVEDGPSGSTTVSQTGTFCIRIALRDRSYEDAERSYDENRQRTGPRPTPRMMTWDITVTTP